MHLDTREGSILIGRAFQEIRNRFPHPTLDIVRDQVSVSSDVDGSTRVAICGRILIESLEWRTYRIEFQMKDDARSAEMTELNLQGKWLFRRGSETEHPDEFTSSRPLPGISPTKIENSSPNRS